MAEEYTEGLVRGRANELYCILVIMLALFFMQLIVSKGTAAI